MWVYWEELWFRGIFLDLTGQQWSKITASLIFGCCFVFLHMLNPDIKLLNDGFSLFIAGYTLMSLCYFVFETIWAPIGMHLANNLLNSLLLKKIESNEVTYVLALFLIAVIFTLQINKLRSTQVQS